MSLSLLELNNAYPPVWLQDYSSGKTLGDVPVAVAGELNPVVTPVISGNSALRQTSGQDYANYMVRQRMEGDLFHRDLILANYLSDFLNLIAQRSGMVYNTPTTVLAPNRYVVVAHLGGIQTPQLRYTGLFVSAARCVKKVDSGNCGLRIMAGDTLLYTAPVATPSNNGNMFTTGALAYTNRGFQLTASNTAGQDIRIEIFNAHSTNNAEVGGFVALVPNTV